MSLVQAVMIMEALQGHERFGIQPAVCVDSRPPSPDPTAKSFLQDSGTPGKVALK